MSFILAVFAASLLSLCFVFGHEKFVQPVSYGPRPFYLVDSMSPSPLKTRLMQCMGDTTPAVSTFSIGHRGAALQFPEHTKESYVAAYRMGAGIIECDVTFTKDLELVCRHSQCDLHMSTNILMTPLAAKCSEPFKPATNTSRASARCCTSDITLAEFKTLVGKMDAVNPAGTTVEEYMDGTPSCRTDWYVSSGNVGTLMTHAESVVLFKSLGAKFTPELKSPGVDMPFNGWFTQKHYAQKLVDEYVAAGVPAEDVWLQSFNLDDVLYWVNNTPRFGLQAVFLDERYDVPEFDPNNGATFRPTMRNLFRKGVRFISPPLWMLLKMNANGKIVPSLYARLARKSGLNIITWTLERSGTPPSGWYMQSIQQGVQKDGDIYTVLDVLAREVKIKGIFTDWPATVTFYANCMGL